jgi:tripartite-type tricarboxylate transporter receptor subunit TctC
MNYIKGEKMRSSIRKGHFVIRAAISLLAAYGLACSPALSQDAFPSKPVKIVVGFPPGGGNDLLGRIIADKLSAALGQPFVVENRPGANGIVAIEAVKRSAPDGYTLMVGPSSGMTVNPAVYAKLPYNPVKDFAPVSMMGIFPLIVTVHPSVPASNVRELIALAKAQPGRINYSSAATSFQLATEMFAQQAGVTLYHIPYKGSAQAVNAVLANEVALTFADGAAVMPLIKSAKLRAIAVSSAKRTQRLPDVPTLAEAGVPGYEMVLWSGVFAPAGTPSTIVSRLQKEIARAVFLPDVRERMLNLGVEPIGSTSEDLAATMRAQIAEYTRVAKTGNITAE